MEIFKNYDTILVPLIIGLIVQAIKLVLDDIRGNFTWHDIITNYGGMPSFHASLVVSLVTIVGLKEGVTSTAFGIAFILMTIVIRDALGLRMVLETHSKTLHRLSEATPKSLLNGLPKLRERQGHTPAEVAIGGVIGIALTLAYFMLFY